jgi:hypothetical protein
MKQPTKRLPALRGESNCTVMQAELVPDIVTDPQIWQQIHFWGHA